MFETYKLNEKGFDEVKAIKMIMTEAVDAVLKIMPEGREKAIFKTKLEEAMFFGIRSVAMKEGNFDKKIRYNVGAQPEVAGPLSASK
ncbi:MAG: hypothetical protein IPJ84_19185 [Bdellovibrionales bacterium]|nr:hypothetical protein [Bdellovibrionales bacterium]